VTVVSVRDTKLQLLKTIHRHMMSIATMLRCAAWKW